MKTQKHELSLEIIKATREALNKVGEEEFSERGPDDVMNLVPLTEKYQELSLKEKIQISGDLKEYFRCSETLADILINIEHELMVNDEEMNRPELKQIVDAGHEILKDSFSDLYATYQGS